jgi:hypothetical protein
LRAILREAVRLGLKVEQLRVNAVAFDETVKRIAPPSAALVALDAQRVELADNVTEDDRRLCPAKSGGYNAPSSFGFQSRSARNDRVLAGIVTSLRIAWG